MATQSGVPMYQQSAQVNGQVSPSVPQGSPAMMGTGVYKEIAGFGENMSKLGTTIAEHAINMQKIADDNAVVRTENDFRKYMNEVMYNEQSGLAIQKGHNAEGATQSFDKLSQKKFEEAIKNLPSTNQQVKFYERTSKWLDNYRNAVAKNQATEVQGAYLKDIDTSIENAQNAAMQAPGAIAFSTLLAQEEVNRADLMHFTGMSEKTADAYLMNKASATYVQMATAMNAAGDAAGIEELYRVGHGKVNADAEQKVSSMNAGLKIQSESGKIIAGWKANKDFYNGNGVFNAAKAYEENDKLYGPNATKTVYVPGSGVVGYIGKPEVDDFITKYSNQYGVDTIVAAAIAMQENGGDNIDNEKSGAMGVMQLMPETAQEMGVQDPHNVEQNIEGGIKYLSHLMNDYGYDLDHAIAAYNAGPGNVKQDQPVPNPGYVNDVKGYIEKFKAMKPQARFDLANTPAPEISSEVSSTALTDATNQKMLLLNAAYFQKYGEPLYVTSMAREGDPNASWHNTGEAIDIADNRLATDPEARQWLMDESKKLGFYPLDEYAHPSAHATGPHVHLSNRTGSDKIAEYSGGVGAYTPGYTKTVSASNPKLYEANKANIAIEAARSKSNYDNNVLNAINAMISACENATTYAEIQQAVAANYPTMSDDTQRTIVTAVFSKTAAFNNSDHAHNRQLTNEGLQDRARIEEEASRAFYEWCNKHPEASATEVAGKAQEVGMSPKEEASILTSYGVGPGLTPKSAWAKNPDNEKAFNDTCASYKLTGIEKTQIRQKLNIEAQERDRPLTAIDIQTFVQSEAQPTVINRGVFGGTTVKRADIPPGWTETSYGVLDPNGNTMEYDEDTQEWKVKNAE